MGVWSGRKEARVTRSGASSKQPASDLARRKNLCARDPEADQANLPDEAPFLTHRSFANWQMRCSVQWANE